MGIKEQTHWKMFIEPSLRSNSSADPLELHSTGNKLSSPLSLTSLKVLCKWSAHQGSVAVG